jgi:hypothetical protein
VLSSPTRPFKSARLNEWSSTKSPTSNEAVSVGVVVVEEEGGGVAVAAVGMVGGNSQNNLDQY